MVSLFCVISQCFSRNKSLRLRYIPISYNRKSKSRIRRLPKLTPNRRGLWWLQIFDRMWLSLECYVSSLSHALFSRD